MKSTSSPTTRPWFFFLSFSLPVALVLAMCLGPVPADAQVHPARHKAQMHSMAADEAAIRQVASQFVVAFNYHDAHALAMLFAPDADYTNIYGETRHGRPAIEKLYASRISGVLKVAHRDDEVKSIRFLGPALAEVDSTRAVRRDPTAPLVKGLLTWVMTRRGGHWYILIFHEIDFPKRH